MTQLPRLPWLKLLGCMLLIIAMSGEKLLAEARPNVLFFFADDWGKLAGFYRDPGSKPSWHDVAKTPHLDQHAAQAVVFRNAFVNAPSCTPCRSSLLSGQYFWRAGSASILRGAIWNENLDSWPLMLQAAGYHIGKSHKVWSPGTPVDAPYGQEKFAYERAGAHFNNFSQQVTKRIGSGQSVDQAKSEVLQQVAANFRDFLKVKPQDQPFCYWFGPTNTHRLWTKGSGQKLWDINPDDLKGKLPAFMPDVPEVRQDVADYLGEIAALDAAFAVLKEILAETNLLDNTLIVISGDHGPPGFLRGKCNLYDFGTAVPLVISGPQVAGGRLTDQLVSLVDLAPTILEVVGLDVPDRMSGSSLKGLLESVEGEKQFERTYVYAGRERHVDTARAGYLPYPQRSIRSQQYLLIKNFHPERYPMGEPYHLDEDPAVRIFDDEIATLTPQNLELVTFATLPDEDASPTKAWVVQHRNDVEHRRFYELAYAKRPAIELFDVIQDPDQVKNLADDPAYATVRQQLLESLESELRASDDPRMIDGGRFFETPPMAGPAPAKPTARRR